MLITFIFSNYQPHRQALFMHKADYAYKGYATKEVQLYRSNS